MSESIIFNYTVFDMASYNHVSKHTVSLCWNYLMTGNIFTVAKGMVLYS